MQTVAQGWLVYRLTDSSFLLGLVTFLGQAPALFISPFAGVLADRMPLRKMVAWTQAGMALQALALAVLVFTGHVTFGWILGLATVAGILNAVDMPARQTFLVELAGKDDLASAIALSSSAFNSARVLGTSVGGVLVAAVGEGACFAVNAVTFTATIVVVAVVRPPHVRDVTAREPPLRSLLSGLGYARRTPHTRLLLLLVATVSLVASPYIPMLPVFARDVLHGGPELLGGMNAAVGVGSIVGALLVAALADRLRLFGRVGLGMACMGLSMVVIGLSASPALTLAALPFAGFGLVTLLASANTLLQTEGDPAFHGRVMSLYSTVVIGLYPVGSLVFGAIAERTGVGPTVAVAGVVTVLAAATLGRQVARLRAGARQGT